MVVAASRFDIFMAVSPCRSYPLPISRRDARVRLASGGDASPIDASPTATLERCSALTHAARCLIPGESHHRFDRQLPAHSHPPVE